MSTAFVTHPDCLRHDMGYGHPEQPARLEAVREKLIASQLYDLLQHYEAPKATREQLVRVHDPNYVDAITAAAPNHGLVQLDPDTAMNPHSYAASLRAAGALVLATELVCNGEVENAFCNVRPPGHHAEHNRAMGFCLFNNIAVGVAHALDLFGLQRVAIVDFDVHHGNGTEDIFTDESRVMLCSTFQHPFYPFSGADSASDRLVNVPLPGGSTGQRFRQMVQKKWLPALERFMPEMIFISAGFDAHVEDPLGGLMLNEADYAWVTEQVMAVARRFAAGRIVSTLEGGYDLSALGRSAAAHIRVLMGIN